MANYRMTRTVLVLDEADRDQLKQVIAAHQLPPSNRMLAALEAAFKVGYEQRHQRGERRAA